MIYKKVWTRRNKGPGCTFFRYTGYFLLGIIPVFISREGLENK